MQTFLIRQQTVNITPLVSTWFRLTPFSPSHVRKPTVSSARRSLRSAPLHSVQCIWSRLNVHNQCAQPMCMHLQPCRPCICLTCVTAAGVPSSSPEQPYIAQCTTDCHLKPTEKFQSRLTGGLFVGRFG